MVSLKLLPRFVTLKADNGHLLTLQIVDGIPYLTFTSLEQSRLATHEIIYHPELPDVVMIRSSNGRYWSRSEDNWIVASKVDTPAPCDTAATFKIVRLGGGGIALQSLSDGSYLRWLSQSQLRIQHGCSAVSPSHCDVHTRLEIASAADTALVLPRFLMLKGDSGLLLECRREGDKSINWLRFAGSKGDLVSAHEVAALPDGNVLIQSVKSGKFWRASCVNWVWADVDQANALSNSACHFEPIKVSGTEVALRSVSSGRLLTRYTEYWKDALCALGPECGVNDPATHLVVGNAVVSQSLEEIAYTMEMAEVVEVKGVAVAAGSAENKTDKTCDVVIQVKFSCSVSRSQRWSDSGTFVAAGPRTSFTVGVPEVSSAEGSITVGGTQCFKTKMGVAIEDTVQFQSTFTVKDVEPGEEVTIKVECTQGKCRVPFTYSAKQQRIDGISLPALQCVDGLFEGVSVFDSKAVMTSTKRKNATYLPVCCSFAAASSRDRRRRIPAAL